MSASVATLAEFVEHINRKDSPPIPGDPDAVEMQLHLDAAQGAVERITGPIVVRDFLEHVTPTATGAVLLDRTPVVEITSVAQRGAGAESGPGWDPAAVAALDVDLGAGIVHGLAGANRWQIGYRAGRVTVDAVGTVEPNADGDDVSRFKLAVLITAAHLYSTQRGKGAPANRVGTNADGGTVAQQEAVRMAARAGFALPPMVLELIGRDETSGFA